MWHAILQWSEIIFSNKFRLFIKKKKKKNCIMAKWTKSIMWCGGIWYGSIFFLYDVIEIKETNQKNLEYWIEHADEG